MKSISELLVAELGERQAYIDNVIALLDDGNTIPFIARYRKEMHGSMDDTKLLAMPEDFSASAAGICIYVHK